MATCIVLSVLALLTTISERTKGDAQEVLDRVADALLVVVGGQCDRDPFVRDGVGTDGLIDALVCEQDKKIEDNRPDPKGDGNAAVPHHIFANGTKRSVEAKQVPWNDEPDADEVQDNPNEKQQYAVH